MDASTNRARTRVSRTIAQKLICIDWYLANGRSYSATHRMFDVGRKQIRLWVNNREKYLQMNNRRTNRNVIDPVTIRRRGQFPEQEQEVFELFTGYRERGKFIFFCVC